MTVQQRRPEAEASDLKLLQDHHHYHQQYLGSSVMNTRSGGDVKKINDSTRMNASTLRGEAKRMQGKKVFFASYLSFEGLFLLVCLTASLLLLPLVLPPLPPPPFMLLLLPICIFGLLMFLAFMPSNARDVTYAYL